MPPRIRPLLLRNPFYTPPTAKNHTPSRWYSIETAFPLPVKKPVRRGPCHTAIIGSGPAGFYTAQRILKHLPEAKVDMFEALPVPYGLVRYGVAPDHPEVKHKFEETAQSPNFRFIGNVSIGGGESTSVDVNVLQHYYDAIVFAYGASRPRKLGIEGEDAANIYSAGDFVNWYNGLPSHRHHQFHLDGPNPKRVIIIGQGNVALDVGRILLTPLDVLANTDMPQYAYDALAKSQVKRVSIIGRRGPVQAAFTNKELREIVNIPGAAFNTRFPFPDPKTLPRPQNRMIDLLRKHQGTTPAEKTISLEFCLKPHRFVTDGDRVVGMEFIRQTLVSPRDPKSPVIELADEERVFVPADMVFTSIGYSSVPLRGMAALGINLIRGVLPNDEGRVKAISARDFGLVRSDDAMMERVDGVYAAGWVKTGPTGVIASTMYSSFETGESLVQDWNDGRSFLKADAEKRGWEGFKEEVRRVGGEPIEWEEWKKIEEEEGKRGEPLGKEREKIVDTRQMLALAGHSP